MIAPKWPAALQNRANIRLALGDIEGALDDGAEAIAGAKGPEQASIRLARSLALLSAGRLEEAERAVLDVFRFRFPAEVADA